MIQMVYSFVTGEIRIIVPIYAFFLGIRLVEYII